MPHKSIARNCEVVYNAVDITPHLNTASLQATVEAIDSTNLASAAQEQSPGPTAWSVPVGGDWVKALDDALGPDAVTPPANQRALVVRIGPAAPAGQRVIYTWAGGDPYEGAFISDYQIAANAQGANLLTWSGTLTASGTPVRSSA